MAGHRSPSGRRVQEVPAPHRAPTRHAARHATVTGPVAPRRSVASTTAVFGAVGILSTGAFAAVTATQPGAVADAAEAGTELLANSSDLGTAGVDEAAWVVKTHFAPVGNFADESFDDAGTPADLHLAAIDKADRIAERIAEEHARQAEIERINAIIARGGLDGWIAEALRVCDLPQSLAPAVKKIIMKESGGNPRAINNWDANAQRGTPSQGLMQTIPSTFHAYVHPSLADRPITDPVANITAGVRYMIANYGMSTLQAGGRTNSSGQYIGY